MTRFLLFAAALTILASTGVEARLMSAHLPPPDDSSHVAVHLPTGCRAEVILRDRALIKARITDPSCLPKGVPSRDVPGSLFDFTVKPR